MALVEAQSFFHAAKLCGEHHTFARNHLFFCTAYELARNQRCMEW